MSFDKNVAGLYTPLMTYRYQGEHPMVCDAVDILFFMPAVFVCGDAVSAWLEWAY